MLESIKIMDDGSGESDMLLTFDSLPEAQRINNVLLGLGMKSHCDGFEIMLRSARGVIDSNVFDYPLNRQGERVNNVALENLKLNLKFGVSNGKSTSENIESFCKALKIQYTKATETLPMQKKLCKETEEGVLEFNLQKWGQVGKNIEYKIKAIDRSEDSLEGLISSGTVESKAWDSSSGDTLESLRLSDVFGKKACSVQDNSITHEINLGTRNEDGWIVKVFNRLPAPDPWRIDPNQAVLLAIKKEEDSSVHQKSTPTDTQAPKDLPELSTTFKLMSSYQLGALVGHFSSPGIIYLRDQVKPQDPNAESSKPFLDYWSETLSVDNIVKTLTKSGLSLALSYGTVHWMPDCLSGKINKILISKLFNDAIFYCTESASKYVKSSSEYAISTLSYTLSTLTIAYLQPKDEQASYLKVFTTGFLGVAAGDLAMLTYEIVPAMDMIGVNVEGYNYL